MKTPRQSWYEQPIKECPKCHVESEDYDGFGVLYCPKCGYCQHASATGDYCDFCHKKVGEAV